VVALFLSFLACVDEADSQNHEDQIRLISERIGLGKWKEVEPKVPISGGRTMYITLISVNVFNGLVMLLYTLQAWNIKLE
jgi:hypothetical protein